MRSLVIRYCACKSPIKTPPNPSGVMGMRLSDKEVDRLMDPIGFLDSTEQAEVEQQINKAKELSNLIAKIAGNQPNQTPATYELDKNGMPPEMGFKVQGLEPTRYGDWIGRGRLTDF